MNWIPVSTNPPEPGWYLAWLTGQKSLSVVVAFYHGDGVWNFSDRVTHWMPLPEAPTQ